MHMNSDWHWGKVTDGDACTFIHTSQVSSDGHTLCSWQLRQSRQNSTHQIMSPGQVCDRRWGYPSSFITDFIIQSVHFSSWRVNLLLLLVPVGFHCSMDGLLLYVAGVFRPDSVLNQLCFRDKNNSLLWNPWNINHNCYHYSYNYDYFF